jgi:hypothetical protein
MHYEKAPRFQKVEVGWQPPLPGDGANQFPGGSCKLPKFSAFHGALFHELSCVAFFPCFLDGRFRN